LLQFEQCHFQVSLGRMQLHLRLQMAGVGQHQVNAGGGFSVDTPLHLHSKTVESRHRFLRHLHASMGGPHGLPRLGDLQEKLSLLQLHFELADEHLVFGLGDPR
jgi:hypothetical protein